MGDGREEGRGEEGRRGEWREVRGDESSVEWENVVERT